MKRLMLLFPVMLIFLISGIVKAENNGLVWLVIDQLTLDELIETETPNIDYLQQEGAFGLMNVRTAGHLQPESTYLTAGTGKRCQGSKISHIGKKHGIGAVNDRILELQELNNKTEYHARIGKLGEISTDMGVKIAVLGNTDTLLSEKRTIVTMVMDKGGVVPYAAIGKEILEKLNPHHYPWGYRTDWVRVKQEFLKFWEKTNVIFVETGDLTRIEEYRNIVDNNKVASAKQQALQKIDDFLGFILNSVNLNEVQVGIIVPTPPSTAITKGEKLSFLVVAGSGVEKGWLTSLSTRRKGMIAITDVLPLYQQGLGVKSDDISYIREEVDWEDLKSLNKKITLISQNRVAFVRGFIIVQLLLIVWSVLKILFNKLDKIIIFQKLYEYLLLTLLLIPLNFLFISNVGLHTSAQLLLFLLLLTITEVFFLIKLVPCKLKRLLFSTGLLVVFIIYDLLTGYRLMADSLLGYSSVIGARYYGLGNEYMGLFIGSMLITFTGLLELYKRKKKWASKILLGFTVLIMTYFIGAPDLGANFGGTVTALSSGGIAYYYLHKRNRLLIILISIMVLTGIIYLNYSGYFGTQTHIGKAVELLINGDWKQIEGIIYRKISMNIKLLRWTIWSRVLLAFIIFLIFLFKHPVPVLRQFLISRPFLAGAFYGTLFGSIVTMMVNDSGVVAAATLLFYPLLTLLYFL